ncbi:hypothetical protein SEMRO_1656_G289040.1 [Seminavis robusta]|uniref:Uncharacterized protein n=1 Tax=Seminavis robusta TaxID=568900 RepID=A0A9N8ESK5_9STRA|nr:hypothetical protein SEMRO_1656_G289040.1 [Seminavis robusta]|eukprot:Sro1656_g289040.1 n/a (131) ;mRNA; r:17729-18121
MDMLFYSQDDQDNMMEDAEMVATGWMSQEDTVRGLERFFPKGRLFTEERRHILISAVLEEQQRLQEECDVFDMDQQKVLAKSLGNYRPIAKTWPINEPTKMNWRVCHNKQQNSKNNKHHLGCSLECPPSS